VSQSTRLRDIIAVLEARHHPVPVDVFLRELGISLTTFKRDIAELKETMQAPIVWKRGEGGAGRGYILEDKNWSAGKLGLPRAWFTASEIHALLMIDELAKYIGPGLLTEHLQPLITRITLALSAAKDRPEDIRSRVQILASASRRRMAPHFEAVAQATVRQMRLEITYDARNNGERSMRIVSPQRLVHYKENWYLSAWCHAKDGLRLFSVDSIKAARQLEEPALSVPKEKVDAEFSKSFGLFGGENIRWAKLRFSPDQARWVSAEVWHSEQKAEVLEDGRLLLEVPFTSPKELLLDILRVGPEVEVLEPSDLRSMVIEKLQKALSQYL